MTDVNPFIGQTVHYVSYGTPGGEYTSRCRAAIITEIGQTEEHYNFDNEAWVPPETVVGLAVLNPTGLLFHPIDSPNGPCRFDDENPTQGGTWHFMHPHEPEEASS